MNNRKLRGIHSAVVAVIVAIVMIAVGIAIVSGIVPIGKHAAKKGVLEVLGTPVVTPNGQVSLTVKNIGNDAVTVKEVHILVGGTDYSCQLNQGNGVTVNPGASSDITCSVQDSQGNPPSINTSSDVVSGYLVTDYGTLTVNFVVVSS